MSDEPENLTLRMLRGIDEKLDRIEETTRNLQIRMTAVEIGVGEVNRRLDQIDARLLRLERRTGLIGSDTP